MIGFLADMAARQFGNQQLANQAQQESPSRPFSGPQLPYWATGQQQPYMPMRPPGQQGPSPPMGPMGPPQRPGGLRGALQGIGQAYGIQPRQPDMMAQIAQMQQMQKQREQLSQQYAATPIQWAQQRPQQPQAQPQGYPPRNGFQLPQQPQQPGQMNYTPAKM